MNRTVSICLFYIHILMFNLISSQTYFFYLKILSPFLPHIFGDTSLSIAIILLVYLNTDLMFISFQCEFTAIYFSY